MPFEPGTAEYWETRAAEALARAEQMHDPEAIRTMCALATLFQRMAQRAAGREEPEATKE